MPTARQVAGIAVGATALVALSAVVTSALLPEPLPLCRGWIDPDAPAKIRELAEPVEKLTNLEGFGEYLAGIAWVESRGNPQAGEDTGNAARGWFGIRPNSARVYELGLDPSVLKDGPSSVGLAAWYLHRCLPYAAPGQSIDWLAIRRCWGYPTDVDEEGRPGYKERFSEGLRCAGIDPKFMYKKAIRWNYHWPGVAAVMEAVGRPLPIA